MEKNGMEKDVIKKVKLIFKLKKEGNGNIKEFYYNDKLEYEGEYLNGERNGNGKKYYSNNKLK